ncbi:hypothetical protein [Effusibacillus dendaii]|uniref:hypothetical protein n=1 Tax=Effusibacillus dendaii TaxID=2743772 RepID=UPI001CF7E085|nr:hypothetical protein [Effusibacillus dendaii]
MAEYAVSPDSFLLLSGVKGSGKLFWENGQSSFTSGDHCLLPATLGGFQVTGELDLIVTSL